MRIIGKQNIGCFCLIINVHKFE